MASTTALFTGLSGLNASARSLDVIGNNIANVNTTAFKSNRLLFASQFSRNLSLGGVPGDSDGGSNPAQIGLGVTVAGTQRNFNSGSLSATGDARDLAIEGEGFFVVSRDQAGTNRFFTRAGAFRQNALNDLTTVTGERLLGYGVDNDFNIVGGTLTPLNIPVGQLRLAEPTTSIRLDGNLNAGGSVPTQGSRTTLAALTDTTGAFVAAGTLLSAVDDPSAAGLQALYADGEQIQIVDAEKGGKVLPTATLVVDAATTTVQDLMDFIRDTLGINTGAPADPAGFTPGVSLDPLTGIITVVGNSGATNDLRFSTTNFRHLDAAGAALTPASPIATAKVAAADGESIRTTMFAYDSLGNEVTLDFTAVLESKGNGTTWRYYLESADNTVAPGVIGTGTISFDNEGRYLPALSPVTVTIDRTGTGAVTPLTFDLEFASNSGSVSALDDTTSTLAQTFQDGTPLGVLTSFSVGNDGTITGGFDNGLTRTIGQVAVATFSNAEGLVDVGNNLFFTGPNSGTAVITTPTLLGTGRLVGGALELSNVDLAAEFINLIQASTGYSASSRVITTTDQLIQQLLTLGR
ncbi:MAG: flagellar hook protein FlgE [Phycisphaerales bacterium]